MKKLNVIAAALGWETIERSGSAAIGDIKFEPKESVFPAVTSVAQASLRTGATPLEHGVISNGFWFEDLKKPMFWEQSAALVKGPRVWDSFRANGGRIGLYFFQQSLGENVDVVVSPAPIHAHDGSLIMNCYAKPSDISQELNRRIGEFSLHRYWGPLASPKIGREVIDWFEGSLELWDVDEAYLYLPTLDYPAQKYGPGSKADRKAFLEFEQQILRLQKICDRKGAAMSVEGDYNITAVTLPEVMPNVVLRREGFLMSAWWGAVRILISILRRRLPSATMSIAFLSARRERKRQSFFWLQGTSLWRRRFQSPILFFLLKRVRRVRTSGGLHGVKLLITRLT